MNPWIQAVLDLLAEVRNWVLGLWDTANWWARWVVVLVAAGAVFIPLAAFHSGTATGVVTLLLPFGAVLCAIVAYPIIGGAGLAVLWPVIGAEVLMGLYFTVAPLGSDRWLVLPAWLTFLALGFLWRYKPARGPLVITLAVIAVVGLLGGRDGVKDKYEDAVESVSRPRPPGVTRTPASASRVIEVDSVWVTVEFPEHHRQEYAPERRIEMRLLDGRVYEIMSDLTMLQNGDTVSGPVRIPGYSVDLRSKDLTTNRVVVTTRPKANPRVIAVGR